MSLEKSTSSARRKNGGSTADTLNREWQRIGRLRDKNERLQETMQTFEQECMAAIRDAEVELTEALAAQTRHIAGFLTRKSMTQWQHLELFNWIRENLTDLAANPFCDHQTVVELAKEIDAIGQKIRDRDAPADRPEPDLDDFDEPNATQDGFDDEAGPDPHAQTQDWVDEEDGFEDTADTAARERRQSLDQLLQGSSIKTLFRQLTRRLHPDREQDPEKKRVRDEQMARATEARDNHDIFTLLTMYEEHVGASPFPLLGADEDKILELLKSQTAELRRQQHAIIHANPFRSFIYDTFYDQKRSVRERKLREHCEQARATAADQAEVTRSIHSIPTLRPYLEQRYDNAAMPYFMF